MGSKKGVAEMIGTLYIVSTPIGNLKDVTYRSLEILGNVHLIAAEDTRRTGILLKHYSIRTPLTSFNSYNQEKKSDRLIARIKKGMTWRFCQMLAHRVFQTLFITWFG